MKEIRSDEARRTWRDLLGDVEHHGEHVTILRYNTPAAVIVPVEWYESAKESIMSDAGRVALEKKLRDGRTAVVTITPSGRTASTTATVDGTVLGSHAGPYHAVPRALRDEHPEFAGAIGKLVLTAAEAEQVDAAWREVTASIAPDLDGKRAALVTARDEAEREPALAAAARMDDGGYGNPFSGPEYEAAQAAALRAQAELDAFDAQHPDVAQRAARRRDAMVRRVIDGGL